MWRQVGIVLLLVATPATVANQRALITTPQAVGRCWPAIPEGWSGVLLIADRDRVNTRADGRFGPVLEREISRDTRFNILSLNKMLTGVAIGQLADRGLLRFDDPVRRHVPELPETFAGITVADLLTHTSGLGDYLQEAPIDLARPYRASDLIGFITVQTPTGVGEIRYSNTGYLLAGIVVERLTGMSYQDYVERHIFEPAGMTSASFEYRAGDAVPYAAGADGRSSPRRSATIYGGPAGGAFMTASDLYRFARALVTHRLTRPETTDRLTSIQRERLPRRGDGLERGWGLGFGVTGKGAGRTFGHVGGIPQAGAALRIRGERVVVALAAQDAVPAAPLSSAAMDTPVTSAHCS